MKVGLSLPQAADYGDGGSWTGIARLARMAEEGGADSLWVADHFLYRDEKVETGIHEAFTLLTAAAAVTTRVEIGPLVAATSFRSPGMLAKVAAALDFVSDGRLHPRAGLRLARARVRRVRVPVRPPRRAVRGSRAGRARAARRRAR